MTCPQLAYRQRLAPVAAREIAAAKAQPDGTYSHTWHSQDNLDRSPGQTRAKVLDMIAAGPLTTNQIRARLVIANNTASALLLRMERDGLVQHEIKRIEGRRQALWHKQEEKA